MMAHMSLPAGGRELDEDFVCVCVCVCVNASEKNSLLDLIVKIYLKYCFQKPEMWPKIREKWALRLQVRIQV